MIPGGGARTLTRFWFNTTQAGEYAGRHRDTVEKACQSGELHGVQRTKRGHWRIHKDCLEAWVAGAKCEHQRRGALVAS